MPSIVILNGPSSAGKTTLARALRDKLGPRCVALSIDQFFAFTHRDAKNHWQLFDALTAALFAAAASFADSGFDVIVDTVFERPDSHETAKRVLAHRPFRLIAVTAPLPVLEAREQVRGDRRPGQARGQHERVFVGIPHDARIDTAEISTEACVDRLTALIDHAMS